MGFTSETRTTRRALAGAANAHGVVLAQMLAHRPAIAPQVQVQVHSAGTGEWAGAASEVPNTAAASGERPAGPLALLREDAPPPIALALAQFTIIAVNGDPANIGAKPQRVVHARLLDAQVL